MKGRLKHKEAHTEGVEGITKHILSILSTILHLEKHLKTVLYLFISYIKLIHTGKTHLTISYNITLTHTIKCHPYLSFLVISPWALQSLQLPPLEQRLHLAKDTLYRIELGWVWHIEDVIDIVLLKQNGDLSRSMSRQIIHEQAESLLLVFPYKLLHILNEVSWAHRLS